MTLEHCWMPGVLGLALVGVVAFGCDDSNTNPAPDDSVISAPKGGKSGTTQSGKAGKGGESAAGKASPSSQGGSSGGGAGGSSGGGSGGSSGAAAGKGGTGQLEGSISANPATNPATNAECKDKTDCFCGAPKEQANFLNQCTDAQCTHFDNSKLKKWNGEGTPPALP